MKTKIWVEILDPSICLRKSGVKAITKSCLKVSDLACSVDVFLPHFEMILGYIMINAEELSLVEEKDFLEQDQKRAADPEPPALCDNEKIDIATLVRDILGKIPGDEYGTNK